MFAHYQLIAAVVKIKALIAVGFIHQRILAAVLADQTEIAVVHVAFRRSGVCCEDTEKSEQKNQCFHMANIGLALEKTEAGVLKPPKSNSTGKFKWMTAVFRIQAIIFARNFSF